VTHDGQQCFSCSHDETIRFWDTKSGRSLRVIKGHSSTIYSAVLSFDGKMLATCSVGTCCIGSDFVKSLLACHLAFVEGITMGVMAILRINTGSIAPIMRFKSLNSSSCTVPQADKTVRIWDVASGRNIKTFTGHTSHVTAVAWLPNRVDRLVSCKGTHWGHIHGPAGRRSSPATVCARLPLTISPHPCPSQLLGTRL